MSVADDKLKEALQQYAGRKVNDGEALLIGFAVVCEWFTPEGTNDLSLDVDGNSRPWQRRGYAMEIIENENVKQMLDIIAAIQEEDADDSCDMDDDV